MSATIVGQVGSVLIRVLEIPIFVLAWGGSLYGEWLVIAAVPSFLSLSDLGFASAAQRQMTLSLAKGNEQEAITVYQSSNAFIFAVALALCAVFSVVMLAVPSGALNLHLMTPNVVHVVALLLIGSVFFAILRQNPLTALRSAGRYALGSWLSTATDALQAAILFCLVLAGARPVAVAAATLAIQSASFAITTILARRSLSWFRYGFGHARLDVLRSLAAPAGASVAFAVAQAISFQGPRLVIGLLLSPALVTLFVAHRQFTRFVLMVLTLAQPVMVEATIVYGRGEFEKFVAMCRRGMQFVLWLGGAGVVAMIVAGPLIFRLWMNGKMPFAGLLFDLLLATTCTEMFWHILILPAYSLNRHINAAKIYVAVCICVVALIYFGALWAGVVGVAIALLCAELAMFVVAARSASDILRVPAGTLLTQVFDPPLWLVAEARNLLARR